MSMLAEPRRKTKWTLNPRGKIWTDDEKKLGQKLLEKMGWSKGKGLGRKEQGDLEPIRLNYKNDSKGMGFKGSDDDWVQHRDEFNALLSQLNGSDTVVDEKDLEVAANGLEKRSKTSRARVHYHKYVRNKDLSRYSAEDLACILGKRQKPKVETPQDSEQDEKEEDKTEIDEDEESHTHGVTTIKRGNIHEYFASKLAALQQKAGKEEDTDSGKEAKRRKSVTINEEMNLVKEFCSTRTVVEEFSNDSWAVEQVEEVVAELKTKSKKKKRKTEREDVESTAEQDNTNEQSESVETVESGEEGKKKKKKKKKTNNVDLETPSNESVLLDDLRANNDDGEVGNAEESGTERKKKKKQKHSNNEDAPSNSTENTQLATDPVIENGKKKKKKKINEEASRDPPSEPTSANEEPVLFEETSEPPKDKKNKKKKQERDATVTDTETSAIEAAPAEPETSETASAKKKKKKNNTLGAEPVGQLEDVSSQTESTLKGSGKRKRQTESNPEAEAVVTDSRDPEGERVPEKKKRKKDTAVTQQEGSTNGQAIQPQGIANGNGYPTGQSNDLSKKIKRKFQEANFDQFTGSNILEVKGYAYA